MKKIFLIWALIFSNVLLAQNITFIYELKYRPSTEKDSIISSIYFLDVLGKQSVFRSEKDRTSDSLVEKTGFGLGQGVIFSDQLYIQKNLSNKSLIKNIITPLLNDKYYIKIKSNMNWQILPDKTKIGDMDCQKATIQYGGRNWIAWFTQSIPIQEGPYIFSGLPGLIVKVSDDKADYDFNLVRTKNSNKNSLFSLRKGKEIDWETFKKLQLDYYNDPYAGIKSGGIKSKVVDSKGNTVQLDPRSIMRRLQKKIKDNDNTIELDKAVIYP